MITFFLYLFFTISALICMKFGGNAFSLDVTNGLINIKLSLILILAIFMYGTSFILWTIVINKYDLSYIMPLNMAATNILTVLVGISVFQESITPNKIIGIVIALIGVIIMSIK